MSILSKTLTGGLLFALSSYTCAAQWTSETIKDDFTDETKVFASVLSDAGFRDGFIHMGCYPGKSFEVKVGAGKYIGSKRIPNNVKYRVDKNEPVEMTMNSTSKRYVYMNDANSKFVRDLLDGKSSVVVQLTSYDYDISKAKFSLKGSTKAIKQVLDACK
ncbi:hypothetical protein [Vibrio diabolicus]